MSGGRIDLGFKSYLRNFNPLAKLLGVNKMTIRSARRKFLKQYSTDETHKAKLLKKFNESLQKRVIEEVEREFNELAAICVHEVKDDADVLIQLVYPIRDDFIQLRDIQRREDSKALKEIDLKIMGEFLTSTHKWFSGIASHKSLTVQLSDMISLRQEVSHIMDPLNEQFWQKKLDKDIKKVRREAARKKNPIPQTEAEQKIVELEKKHLEKLRGDAETYLKAMDLIWKDVTKLMQLEASRNNEIMLGVAQQLKESGYVLAAPKKAMAIEETLKNANEQVEEQFDRVQKTLNTLQIITSTK